MSWLNYTQTDEYLRQRKTHGHRSRELKLACLNQRIQPTNYLLLHTSAAYIYATDALGVAALEAGAAPLCPKEDVIGPCKSKFDKL